MGIVPRYRGTAALYHALSNRDPAGVGYTLHLVDEGVDTGDILHQEVVPVLAGDSVVAIHDRCERAAVHSLMRILRALDRETDLPRTSQRGIPGHTYRGIPTAHQWHELDAYLRMAAGQFLRGATDDDERAGTGPLASRVGAGWANEPGQS